VELVPSAVGVASTGCEAERSQAANSNMAATASEIAIIIFLDMILLKNRVVKVFRLILAQPF
jgi:hypothetical protein